MKVFASVDELGEAVGTDLGFSEWVEIDQARVNTFADATDDHQWIHVDPDRAIDSPFGGTIAHGLLTLSLTPMLLAKVMRIDGVAMGLNYGYDKVRFITPVKVGARIRGGAVVTSVTEVPGGVQTLFTLTVEIENVAKPACIVEFIVRYYAE